MKLYLDSSVLVDLLHLTAARKTDAKALYTLNARHFSALARAGDPQIEALA